MEYVPGLQIINIHVHGTSILLQTETQINRLTLVGIVEDNTVICAYQQTNITP